MAEGYRLPAYHIAGDVFFALAAATTILRVYVRALAIRYFGLDDMLIVFSMFFGVGMVVNNHLMTRATKAFMNAPAPSATRGLSVELTRETFIQGFLYLWQIGLIKLSLLAFYHRLAPPTRYRYLLYGTGLFTVVFTIACTFSWLFQCSPGPIMWNWEPGDDCAPGALKVQLAFGAINLTTDVVVLLLPVRLVMGLRASWKQRAGLMTIFLLGAVGTAATAVRVWKVTVVMGMDLKSYGKESLHQSQEIHFYSLVEVFLATICANAPAMAALWKLWRRRIKVPPSPSESHRIPSPYRLYRDPDAVAQDPIQRPSTPLFSRSSNKGRTLSRSTGASVH